MIRNNLFKHLLFIFIGLLPIGYLLMVWNTVPATVPVHFDVSGTPNAWGPKTELLTIALILFGATIFSYFLIQNLHKIDPRRANKPQAPVFNKMATGLVFFLSAINLIIIYASLNSTFKFDHVLLPLIGLMFAFLGNIMYSIKPNYFAGIRIPWTLNRDYNWRKTHQLAGKLWFVSGLLITVISFFLSPETSHTAMMYVVGVMVIIPIIYSYIIFRKELATPWNKEETRM